MAKNKINRIEIAQRAQDRYYEMLNNIEKHSSPRVAEKFTDDFEDVVEKLKKNPEIFEYSNTRKDTRRALFSKYGAFLYKIIKGTTILITTFFDTRMKR